MTFTPHDKKGPTEYGLGWFLTELPAEVGWIGINDGRVAKNPIIAEGVAPTPIAYHNGSMPGVLSLVHLIQQTYTAIVILCNTLPFADLPDHVGGMILETILKADKPSDFLPLILEAKSTSIEGPLKTAEKLATHKKSGTVRKPLSEYEGRFTNCEGKISLEVRAHGEGLRMNVQGFPETYYDLNHHHDDIFAWDCDRDREARRAMFPQLSDEFRKVCFQCGSAGKVCQMW